MEGESGKHVWTRELPGPDLYGRPLDPADSLIGPDSSMAHRATCMIFDPHVFC